MSEQDYQDYLKEQLDRTLLKIQTNNTVKASYLLARLAEVAVSIQGARVLCVGCRNSYELNCFEQLGASEVVGIDLQASDPRIQVMDMHSMTFQDQSFDVVYACHSLEHSFEPGKVCLEMLRVTKAAGVLVAEVPIRYQPFGADRWDFGSVSSLRALFPGASELWSEEATAKDNAEQTVARLILRKTTGSPKESATNERLPSELHHPKRLPISDLSFMEQDWRYSLRRYFVDEFYTRHARTLPPKTLVLDIGGKKAKKRGQFNIEQYGLNVKYVNTDPKTGPDYLADATSIPVEDCSFEVVILAEVVEHLPSPGEALAEAYRVLKPGGVLLAAAPFLFRVHEDPIDIARYTPQWWHGSLRQLGFVDIKVEPQGAFFSVIADMIISWLNHLENKKSFWFGTREIVLGSVSWLKRTALMADASSNGEKHEFLGRFTTGYGVSAKRPNS